eukprot:TRINITY_DN5497_c0_g1_i2.p1 TRINITY_DN5497_c0_g1~~TRINITY_DN5497_c0_g1_i2.p1  ORF type:complete len:366 (-),score=95.58 TRINITY_DN5497_c0_g1_i2:61-1158(-)
MLRSLVGSEMCIRDRLRAGESDHEVAVLHNNIATSLFKLPDNRVDRLEAALSHTAQAITLSPQYQKAYFRRAQLLVALGHDSDNDGAVLEALHSSWRLGGSGSTEIFKMLMKHDHKWRQVHESLAEFDRGTQQLKTHLQGMWSTDHPRSLHKAFLSKWTREWDGHDRTTCLASAINHVFNKLNQQAKKIAQRMTGEETKEAQEQGQIEFGEVLRLSEIKEQQVRSEVFQLVDLTIGNLLDEQESAHNPETIPTLIAATCEDKCADDSADDTVMTVHLMDIKSHALSGWLSSELVTSFKQRILVDVSIQTIMSTVGLAVIQAQAQKDWQNERRRIKGCLLYTSDAADEEDSVDLGGRRIIKKKKKK